MKDPAVVSATISTTSHGNTAYNLELPNGQFVKVVSYPDGRIRLDGPAGERLRIEEFYPGSERMLHGHVTLTTWSVDG